MHVAVDAAINNYFYLKSLLEKWPIYFCEEREKKWVYLKLRNMQTFQ